MRAIGGKKDASASADGKKAAAKSVGKEKKSSGKTGTAIGESPLSNLPVPLPVAGGGVLVIGVVLAKILGGRRGGSVASLEERGALDENRYVDDDKFFSGMMKTVRTVEMPELTEAQIRAARERRRQSRDIDASPSTLENVELPANHPFATTAKVIARNAMSVISRRASVAGDDESISDIVALTHFFDTPLAEGSIPSLTVLIYYHRVFQMKMLKSWKVIVLT